jgi:hypothetical protein
MMGILNMAFFEEVVLKDSIEIKTTAEKVFNFLTNIIDDDSYRAWHKEDHVSFRWLKGNPWTEGSVLYIENGLSGVRKHMREEGENLKIILEGEGSSHENWLENDRQ